jgi:hypothetical protein
VGRDVTAAATAAVSRMYPMPVIQVSKVLPQHAQTMSHSLRLEVQATPSLNSLQCGASCYGCHSWLPTTLQQQLAAHFSDQCMCSKANQSLIMWLYKTLVHTLGSATYGPCSSSRMLQLQKLPAAPQQYLQGLKGRSAWSSTDRLQAWHGAMQKVSLVDCSESSSSCYPIKP